MILSKNAGVAVGAQPSILDLVVLQGSTVTPLLSMIQKGSVSNILHSWISDSVEAAAANANVEISGVGTTPEGSKQKTSNVTQIIKNEVKISLSQDAVKMYGQAELKHQLEKGAKKHALDIEFALLGLHNATKYDTYTERVANSTPAKMAGLFSFVPVANRLINGSDIALDKSGFEDMLLPLWEKNNDAESVKLFCSANLKSKINDFMKDYIVHNNKDNTIDYRATRIITDWGIVDVIPHRMFNAANALDKSMIAFDPSTLAYKTLISTTLKDVPTEDTAIIKRYLTEGTLEVLDNNMLVCADKFI